MQGIGEILVGLAVFINAVLAVITYIMTIKAVKVVEKLEINTNSIKDDLVKVTAESEHAKGVIQGKAENQRREK